MKRGNRSVLCQFEGLISKEDLAEQNEYYTQRIAELNEKIYKSKNAADIFDKQIEEIKKQIAAIKDTDQLDIDNTDFYREAVGKVIVQNNRLIDIYLEFLPFGYRIAYTLIKLNKYREFDLIVDSCEIIS